MEKFSRKEKIALGIFGVILLAIIVQMIWKLGEPESLSGGGVVVEEANIGLAGNLLQPDQVKLTASSHNENNQTVNKLIDNKGNTFWHVALDQVGEPAWVKIDFREGNKKKVRKLMALPRKKFPQQFFRRAELFGSDNGEDWKSISRIVQGETPSKVTWREWKFDNDQAYRYYRLLITDGHEDRNAHHFFSMAELALSE